MGGTEAVRRYLVRYAWYDGMLSRSLMYFFRRWCLSGWREREGIYKVME
jgi:hypothetical protein